MTLGSWIWIICVLLLVDIGLMFMLRAAGASTLVRYGISMPVVFVIFVTYADMMTRRAKK